MKKTLGTIAVIASFIVSSAAFSAEPREFISVQQYVNRPRNLLPDLPYLDKSKNDPIAFEIYNQSDRPISCTNLFVDAYVAPIGNCADPARTIVVKFRFKNVSLWKISRRSDLPDPWGLKSLYDVHQYWTPYKFNDLGLNAFYYDLGGSHLIYHERFTGEEDLAEAANRLGLSVSDVEYCPNPNPAVYASDCNFGCFQNDPYLIEEKGQICRLKE